MGSVYKNAVCTIAAAFGTDDNCGLNLSSCKLPLGHALLDVAWRNKKGLYVVEDLSQSAQDIYYSPLLGRCWATQEFLLSPRVILFQSDQIWWSCCTLTLASEIHKNGTCNASGQKILLAGPRKTWSPFTYTFHPQIMVSGRESRVHAYGIWAEIVEQYTTGRLSRKSDKLAAIAGLASDVQHHVNKGDCYLAGLWKSNLPEEMLWEVSDKWPNDVPSIYQAPTWSWASQNGSVRAINYSLLYLRYSHDSSRMKRFWSWFRRLKTWPLRRTALPRILADRTYEYAPTSHLLYDTQLGMDEVRHCLITLIEANVHSEAGNHFLAVSAGHLRLLGWVLEVEVGATSDNAPLADKPTPLLLAPLGESPYDESCVTLDVRAFMSDQARKFALPIVTFAIHGQWIACGIILERTGAMQGQYRRCGRFDLCKTRDTVAFMEQAVTARLAAEDYEDEGQLGAYQINIV